MSVGGIATIGYEGSTVEQVIETLKSADVQVLIDVRDVPVSRKPGFSKTALARLLGQGGVDYVHLRALGNPKPGRVAGKHGDMQAFERIFRDHLNGEPAQQALETALDIASRTRACLLCFERDHTRCHRAMVAEEMARRRGIRIHHLLAHRRGADAADRRRKAR